jgi:hypothetical protein
VIVENTVVLVTRDGMGNVDKRLQHQLFAKYLELLSQHESLTAAFCFYTDGVKLGIVGGMGDILEAQSKAEKVTTV